MAASTGLRTVASCLILPACCLQSILSTHGRDPELATEPQFSNNTQGLALEQSVNFMDCKRSGQEMVFSLQQRVHLEPSRMILLVQGLHGVTQATSLHTRGISNG